MKGNRQGFLEEGSTIRTSVFVIRIWLHRGHSFVDALSPNRFSVPGLIEQTEGGRIMIFTEDSGENADSQNASADENAKKTNPLPQGGAFNDGGVK